MNNPSTAKRSPPEIPVWHKLCLTIEEAAAYSHIGEHTLRKIAHDPKNKSIILQIGTKTVFKRAEFEDFIAGLHEV